MLLSDKSGVDETLLSGENSVGEICEIVDVFSVGEKIQIFGKK